MVTASHNPKQDNGLKVFWGDGCQIVAPQDEEIAAAVAANAFPWPRPAAPRPLASDPTPAVAASYYAILADLRFRPPPANALAASIVYTPLHGVGGPWVTRAFALFGLPTPIPVPSQAEPDPDFPTVAFPNPEEGAGVWDAAFQAAAACGATVCLANDPDADRLAGAWWLAGVHGQRNRDPAGRLVVAAPEGVAVARRDPGGPGVGGVIETAGLHGPN